MTIIYKSIYCHSRKAPMLAASQSKTPNKIYPPPTIRRRAAEIIASDSTLDEPVVARVKETDGALLPFSRKRRRKIKVANKNQRRKLDPNKEVIDVI